MHVRFGCLAVVGCLATFLACPVLAEEPKDSIGDEFLTLSDVFELEYASDPQISPDGERVVYVRNFMDIMADRRRSNLWIIDFDGSNNRPLTSGNGNYSSPRWSPDGSRLLYVASSDGSSQVYVRWMDTGQEAKLTQLPRSPGGLVWSPDGKWISFSMLVPEPSKPFVEMPAAPKGAQWAEPAKVIDDLTYRADGAGFLEHGFTHLFVLSAEGGTPRRLTSGNFNHGSTPSWTPDGKSLIFSANRHDDWEYEPLNSEVYELSITDRSMKQLTTRKGPDRGPVVSPDGKKVAYIGFDDRYQAYQIRGLYVMNRDGSDPKLLTKNFDRSVSTPKWRADGAGLYVQYTDRGNTKIAFVPLAGKMETLARNVGGLSLGRPYSGGSFSLAANGRFAFTHTRPDHPADVAVGGGGLMEPRRITHLNDDLLAHKKLAHVHEILFRSSHDRLRIQGWIADPPDFDPTRKYPLILEIHGGPVANYGDRFAMEIQLYAAAGYLVLYINPRGSTSYGEEFGNLIHHNYPGEDYDDLMSGVEAILTQGFVDEDNMFVTGGSGGGVLTSWIVGKTDRFQAAVVAKPVINWYSFVLTADMAPFFYKYWFPGFPWDHQEHYMKRSPLSLVGNVTTPTMLLTGEMDYRTPIAESEQFYQALKLRKIETVMVRIPGASHGISTRPSNLISKVAHILKWFDDHRTDKDDGVKSSSDSAAP